MSETIPQPEEEPQPTPEPEPQPQPEPAPEPEEPPAAASKAAKRISHLSARANEATRRAEAAERELEQARALLAQRNGETPPAPPPVTEADIDARAERKLAERLVAEKRQEIIQAGVAAFGQEQWNEATNYIATAGMLKRPEFMDTLVELDNAHQVVAALADDPDAVASMLALRPTALAARLGRMSAELSMDKPTNTISKAPPPVKPVAPGRTAPAPDPAKMSTQQYLEFRKRTAPKHLGGQGQAA